MDAEYLFWLFLGGMLAGGTDLMVSLCFGPTAAIIACVPVGLTFGWLWSR